MLNYPDYLYWPKYPIGWMKTYSFTDVSKTPGAVLEEALKAPVVLTKRGKEKLVVVPADYFRRLTGRPHAAAYSLHELPAEIGRQLDEGLETILGKPPSRSRDRSKVG